MVETARRPAPREDRRSRRTRQMLGDALTALMLEQRYDTITVQEISERANVGRSTFYAHFLDKEDLLQHQIAGMIAAFVAHMDQDAGGRRLVPSLELLRHVRERRDLCRALVRGRAMEPVLATMQTHLTAHIEARLARRLPPGAAPAVPLPLLAHHAAAALLALFQWWLARDMADSPEAIDAYFLHLVRPSVQVATGIEL
jgi:AcrR family transcriptional regulator